MELAIAYDSPSPPLDPESEAVQVWRDVRGRPCVYGQRHAGRNWMHFPGVSSYGFGDSPGTVTAVPDTGAAERDVVDTYYRSVLPTALQRWGSESLHGSAAVLPAGVVVLCARSGTGKSTLAYALRQAGHPLFADDAVVFDISNGAPRLRRLPFEVRLRQASARHFNALPKELMRVTGGVSVRLSHHPPPRLAAVLLLERSGEEAEDGRQAAGGERGAAEAEDVARIEPLDPAAAFTAVLSNAYCFAPVQGERKAAMMRNYLALVASTPVLRLRFRPGLDNLPSIVEAVEEAVPTPAIT